MSSQFKSPGPVRSLVTGEVAIKEVTIHATPARIFAALTMPSRLNIWFTTGAKVDLRAGGRYTNADRDSGRFLEIIRNKRLRFTWDNPSHAPGSVVDIVLAKKSQGTTMTLMHYGFTKKSDFEHYSSEISGWDWALSNLKAYLEGDEMSEYEHWLKKRS